MSLSAVEQFNLEQNATRSNWTQDEVEKRQAALERQQHFDNPTPVTNELGKLAASDRAAKELSIQSVALGGDVDQERVDAIARRQK